MREFLRRRRIVVFGALVVAVAVVVIALALTGVFSGRDGAQETTAGHVAVVNGSEITREALDRAAADLTSYYRQLAGGESDLFDGAAGAYLQLRIFHESLTELIRQTLIRDAARARSISVEEETIEERAERRYQTLLGQYGIAEQQHAAYLEASGSSVEGYKATLRDEVAMQLLTEAVQQAVIEESAPDEEALRARFEEDPSDYSDEGGVVPSFSEVRERVRTEYLDENRSGIITAWYEEILESSAIEIEIPLLRAYDLQTRDPEAGLAEFERLHREGVLADPYLPYYMARLIESRAATAEVAAYSLEELDELSADQARELESLREEERALEARAVSLYIETLLLAEWDGALIARAKRLDPDEPAASFLNGMLMALGGDRDGSTEVLASVLEEDSSFVPAYITLGDLAQMYGDVEEAEAHYEGALAVQPESVAVLLRIAELQSETGHLTEARATLTEVRRIAPNSPWLRIAEGDLAAVELEAAIEEQERASGSTAAAVADRIEATADEAASAYRDALERSGDLDINLKLGRVLLLAGDLDEAQSEFEYVIRHSPYTSAAYEGRGDVLAERGDSETAVEDYRAALALALDSRARVRLLERIVEEAPESVDDRLDLAELYEEQERWDDAVAVYEDALSIDPSLTDVHFLIGEAFRRAGDFRAAVEALERGLDEAGFVTQRKRFLEAILAVLQDEVGEEAPLPAEGLDARLALASLELELGKIESALAEVRSVRATDPSHRTDNVADLLRRIRDEAPSLLTDEERDLL